MVSLEDELVTTYVGKPLQWAAAITLKMPGGFLCRWIGGILFRRAQRSAERMHAKMRRNLLKMDEQTSESLAFSGKTE
jgi:preprotein translocase subunit SecA